jgi:hypothetical protein
MSESVNQAYLSRLLVRNYFHQLGMIMPTPTLLRYF